MKSPQNDYTTRSLSASLLLIAILLVVSFIPPVEVWGVELRRANILSEFIRFEEPALAEASLAEAEVEQIEVDWEQIAEAVAETTTPEPIAEQHPIERHYRWVTRDTLIERAPLAWPDSLAPYPAPKVAIEHFDTLGGAPFDTLYTKLITRRPVRIAFLGDSFVEGDILTADLREQLQLAFGGSGVGFAPMASPLTGFRRTVKTTSKGWTSHNIMQWAKLDEQLKQSFTVAGWVCRPTNGASTRWEGTTSRERLDLCGGANIWFLSRAKSQVEVVVNDSLRRTFTIEPDEALRRIEVAHRGLRSLEFRLHSGAEGFVGYGAQLLDDEGVVVDNYSVRSNNGRALFWSSPSLNAQHQAQVPYDLVILQYGLNIMQQGVFGYSNYGRQIEQMVDYVRQCFPGAAVLVMGVSERWVKGEQGYGPMDALPHMVRSQREAARRAGAAFWATSEAMQALGGMEAFVRNGWAGKDYTHINYGGGRQIAKALFESLCADLYTYWQQENGRRVKRAEEQPLLDSHLIDSLLFTSTPTVEFIP